MKHATDEACVCRIWPLQMLTSWQWRFFFCLVFILGVQKSTMPFYAAYIHTHTLLLLPKAHKYLENICLSSFFYYWNISTKHTTLFVWMCGKWKSKHKTKTNFDSFVFAFLFRHNAENFHWPSQMFRNQHFASTIFLHSSFNEQSIGNIHISSKLMFGFYSVLIIMPSFPGIDHLYSFSHLLK